MKTKPKTRLREERVVVVDDLELRQEEGQPARITGHPIRYGTWSQDLGGFRERVRQGAATKTIAEADIRALFNHDPNIVLGRNVAGTMTLRDQAQGLFMDTEPPDTQTVRDLVLTPMRRGDINQMSFAFRAIQEEWREPADATKKDGLWERDITELKLYDVSVVTFPAYVQTDAAVRSMVDGTSLDFAALSALLIRADRGLPLTGSDLDLLAGSIAALRSYVPSEPEPDAATTPEEPQAGRSVAHLRRLMDLRERELLTA